MCFTPNSGLWLAQLGFAIVALLVQTFATTLVKDILGAATALGVIWSDILHLWPLTVVTGIKKHFI